MIIIKNEQAPQYDETRDSSEIPLASVPLSQLFSGEITTCPICGLEISLDTANVIIDGINYVACKKCVNKPKTTMR
jgi:hypothetical protein